MSTRKRPRNNKPITTVLQAFRRDGKSYGNDFDAYDSMILSLSPGEGIEVYNGNLSKFSFSPATEQGAYFYSKRHSHI